MGERLLMSKNPSEADRHQVLWCWSAMHQVKRNDEHSSPHKVALAQVPASGDQSSDKEDATLVEVPHLTFEQSHQLSGSVNLRKSLIKFVFTRTSLSF